MKLNVVILAGGHGTRLKGVWDKPKCLVPIGSKALLDRLLMQVEKLNTERIVVAVAHRKEEVYDWLNKPENFNWSVRVWSFSEDVPTGTTSVVKRLVGQSLECGIPWMVLNGDTLPYFSLRLLWEKAQRMQFSCAAWKGDQYAGAAVLLPHIYRVIGACSEKNWEATVLPYCMRASVAGFLDVGTPAGFAKAAGIGFTVHTKQ